MSKLVVTVWVLFFLLLGNGAYANIIGPEEAQILYQRVKPTLDQPTPEEPFYLKSENNKRIESG